MHKRHDRRFAFVLVCSLLGGLGGGPDVLFISANTWVNDYEELATVVDRLSGEDDLTFMTPSQLLACLADPG